MQEVGDEIENKELEKKRAELHRIAAVGFRPHVNKHFAIRKVENGYTLDVDFQTFVFSNFDSLVDKLAELTEEQ